MSTEHPHTDQHRMTPEVKEDVKEVLDEMFGRAESLSAAIHNLVGAASLTWANPEGAGEYLSDRALLMAESFLQYLERQPRIVRQPTSCRCGGSEAYLLQVEGRAVMIGCVCHTDLITWARNFHVTEDDGAVHSYEDLFKVNRSRSTDWHANAEPWMLSDWGNALGGEVGELQNVIKKIRRIQTGTGWRQTEADVADLLPKAFKECADVLLYLDLVFEQLEILWRERTGQDTSMLREAVNKFNETSEAMGFPHRAEMP